MGSHLNTVIAWIGVVAAAALPWLAALDPAVAPLAVVLVWVLWNRLPSSGLVGAAATATIALSAAAQVAYLAGVAVTASWTGLAVLVALVAFVQRGRVARWRPDPPELVAVASWAVAIFLRPELVTAEGGGWLAPLMLLWASRRAVLVLGNLRGRAPDEPQPPSRDARGTLSLRGVVLGSQSLARTVPIELELRAGDSLAVLCDNAVDAEALAGVLAGRISPLAGVLAVDAEPYSPGDRLVAVIGPGELFLRGSVETNLGALCEDEPDADALAAAWEACHVNEVARALGDRLLQSTGEPLDSYHRLLLLAARVLPSAYRVVVVADQASWLNAVQAEIWRAVVVRASVGRTAVWITSDRDLAQRASRVMVLRHGSLRPVPSSSPTSAASG